MTQATANPKYLVLAAEMKRKVADGEWKSGEKIPPERELESAFGASRPTVSKALGQLVNEGLLLRRQGSGTFVKATPSRKSNLIQFMYYRNREVLSDLTDHLALLQAIDSKAADSAYRILFGSSCDSQELSHRSPPLEAGLIAVGPVGDEIVRQHQAAGIPVVLVDHESLCVDSIAIDNRAASYQCVDSLIGAGHKRICFVSDMQEDGEEWPNSALRRKGYEDALRDAGVTASEELLVPALENMELAARIEEAAPSAVFFSSSHSCRRFLTERDASSGDPSGMTIAAFGSKDDFPVLPSGMKLMMLVIDWRKMGEIAVDLLLERIRDNTIPTRRILMNPRVNEVGGKAHRRNRP